VVGEIIGWKHIKSAINRNGFIIKIMKITNISDLVINLQNLLDTVANSNESLFIQRPNDKSVIILSMDEFNKLKAKEYQLDKQQSNDNNP